MSNYFNGNGTIGFTCDVCGRELNGCSIVNGMKFCAKCYQETFVKDNQQNEIQKLKQQLEEKEKKIVVANNLRKKSDEVLLNYKTEKYGLDKTIQELRKIKLSMPEKEWYYKGFENCERQISSHIADLTLENKQLKQKLKEKDKEIERLKTKPKPIVMHSKEDYFKRCNFLEEENIKLQFAQTQLAIQELEKLKEEFNGAFSFSAQQEMLDKYINKQIKELKGE